jgi:hypothetical protein
MRFVLAVAGKNLNGVAVNRDFPTALKTFRRARIKY